MAMRIVTHEDLRNLNTRDFWLPIDGTKGLRWAFLDDPAGAGSVGYWSLAYVGDGVVVGGTYRAAGAQIVRSADYGLTWAVIGVPVAGEVCIQSLCHLGGGVVVGGTTPNKHFIRSTDGGPTWTDLGIPAGAGGTVWNIRYLGSRIVLAAVGGAAGENRIYRSTDYGATWAEAATPFPADENAVLSLCYLGNGVVLAGSGWTQGRVARSTDYGLTWTDLGTIIANATQLYSMAYCGDGIIVVGCYPVGKIARSVDYGLTWADMGDVVGVGGSAAIMDLEYVGDGVVVGGTYVVGGASTAHVLRSIDYGRTWTNLGSIAGTGRVMQLRYLGDGIIVGGTYAGTEGIIRSDVVKQLV
jgi:hypothetical protein